MGNLKNIQLFTLTAAVIEGIVERINAENFPEEKLADSIRRDGQTQTLFQQFDSGVRKHAIEMAEHYKAFYMLENDIRKIICETLEANHGKEWWDGVVPEEVKKEVRANITRDDKAALSRRSDSQIDYTTFGQLGEIIRANWGDFAGMMSNQNALGRVLAQLNLSRGPIAHCGILEPDEVDRLYLSIKDWFRVMAGPS